MSNRTFAGLIILLLGVLLISLCVAALSAEKRPGKHPEFAKGIKAFDQGNWRRAAELLQKAADESWPEDGSWARVSGKWFERYLPRYYAGVALYELGCYEQALAQFNDSILSQAQRGEAKSEKEKLDALREKCNLYVRQGIPEEYGANCPDQASE